MKAGWWITVLTVFAMAAQSSRPTESQESAQSGRAAQAEAPPTTSPLGTDSPSTHPAIVQPAATASGPAASAILTDGEGQHADSVKKTPSEIERALKQCDSIAVQGTRTVAQRIPDGTDLPRLAKTIFEVTKDEETTTIAIVENRRSVHSLIITTKKPNAEFAIANEIMNVLSREAAERKAAVRRARRSMDAKQNFFSGNTLTKEFDSGNHPREAAIPDASAHRTASTRASRMGGTPRNAARSSHEYETLERQAATLAEQYRRARSLSDREAADEAPAAAASDKTVQLKIRSDRRLLIRPGGGIDAPYRHVTLDELAELVQGVAMVELHIEKDAKLRDVQGVVELIKDAGTKTFFISVLAPDPSKPAESKPLPRRETGEYFQQSLREIVTRAFEARQAMQQAEVERFRQRLTRIERQITARERNKDAIIDRRVEELLNPELKWESTGEIPSRSLGERKSDGRMSRPQAKANDHQRETRISMDDPADRGAAREPKAASQPESSGHLVVFPLQSASAAELLPILNELGIGGKELAITADRRTNSLMAHGSRERLDRLADLIRILDQPSGDRATDSEPTDGSQTQKERQYLFDPGASAEHTETVFEQFAKAYPDMPKTRRMSRDRVTALTYHATDDEAAKVEALLRKLDQEPTEAAPAKNPANALVWIEAIFVKPPSDGDREEPVAMYRTGTVIGSDGVIATVFDPSDQPTKSLKSLKVHLDNGRIVDGRLVRYDEKTGVAFLKVDVGGLTYLELSQASIVRNRRLNLNTMRVFAHNDKGRWTDQVRVVHPDLSHKDFEGFFTVASIEGKLFQDEDAGAALVTPIGRLEGIFALTAPGASADPLLGEVWAVVSAEKLAELMRSLEHEPKTDP